MALIRWKEKRPSSKFGDALDRCPVRWRRRPDIAVYAESPSIAIFNCHLTNQLYIHPHFRCSFSSALPILLVS